MQLGIILGSITAYITAGSLMVRYSLKNITPHLHDALFGDDTWIRGQFIFVAFLFWWVFAVMLLLGFRPRTDDVYVDKL